MTVPCFMFHNGWKRRMYDVRIHIMEWENDTIKMCCVIMAFECVPHFWSQGRSINVSLWEFHPSEKLSLPRVEWERKSMKAEKKRKKKVLPKRIKDHNVLEVLLETPIFILQDTYIYWFISITWRGSGLKTSFNFEYIS